MNGQHERRVAFHVFRIDPRPGLRQNGDEWFIATGSRIVQSVVVAAVSNIGGAVVQGGLNAIEIPGAGGFMKKVRPFVGSLDTLGALNASLVFLAILGQAFQAGFAFVPGGLVGPSIQQVAVLHELDSHPQLVYRERPLANKRANLVVVAKRDIQEVGGLGVADLLVDVTGAIEPEQGFPAKLDDGMENGGGVPGADVRVGQLKAAENVAFVVKGELTNLAFKGKERWGFHSSSKKESKLLASPSHFGR